MSDKIEIDVNGYTRSVEEGSLITRDDVLKWAKRKTGRAVWGLEELAGQACELGGELVDDLAVQALPGLVIELQK